MQVQILLACGIHFIHTVVIIIGSNMAGYRSLTIAKVVSIALANIRV